MPWILETLQHKLFFIRLCSNETFCRSLEDIQQLNSINQSINAQIISAQL